MKNLSNPHFMNLSNHYLINLQNPNLRNLTNIAKAFKHLIKKSQKNNFGNLSKINKKISQIKII